MSTHLSTLTLAPEVAIARQSLYRLAALALLDPKFGSWEILHELRDDPLSTEAAALLRGLPALATDDLAPGERPLADLDPSPLLTRLPDSRDGFNQHFEETFGLLVSNSCPPYETEYIDGKLSFQRSNELADIYGFYRAFGVTASRHNPDRGDHIVHELEFMALVISLARQADDAGPTQREERQLVCLEAQERFLREHLIWWTPVFTTLLAREDRDGFYAAAARFLSALIAADRTLFGIASPSSFPAPSKLEQPDACEGCLQTP